MKKYSYQQLVDGINAQFKKLPNFQVTVRTIKFWVKDGLLPEPKGGGRWRWFEDVDLEKAISVRKLQVVYGQNNKDIKNLISIVSVNPPVQWLGDSHNLFKLISTLESFRKNGIDPHPHLEALKKHNEFLVWDNTHFLSYRFSKMRAAEFYFELYSPDMADQITTEESLLLTVQKETAAMWNRLATKAPELFEFTNEDIQNAKKLLENKLVYPRVLKGANTRFYKWQDKNAIFGYLTIMRLLKKDAPLDSLRRLKARLTANAQEILYCPPENESGALFNKAEIGFQRASVVNDLVAEFAAILFYLEHGKEDSEHRYLFYANKYFDKETLLDRYLHGFCHFIVASEPGASNPAYFLKDRDIATLSTEQIEFGMKQKILSGEPVRARLQALESDVRTLKRILNRTSGSPARIKRDRL